MKGQLILNTLRKNKKFFFKKYPLKSMSLFGSYARNEETEKSDVDILVEFSTPVGFEFVDLAIDLETLLNQKVDLVSKKAVKPSILSFIEKDMINV